MKVEDFKRVLVIGAGTMGQQIATHFTLCGCDVVVYDIEDKFLEKAAGGMKKLARSVAAYMGKNEEQTAAALKRVVMTTVPEEAASGVDLVSESVPEDPELKGKVFARFNKLCPAHTIFTTNTSTLLPSMFAEATGRPEKFLALHFHDIRISQIVDIMPHPGTARETVALVRAFADRTGLKTILLKRESHGYVFNYLIMAFFEAAQTLAAKGVAEPLDIDRAWMGVTNTPMGPFAMMDSVGLETVWKVTEFWAKRNNDAKSQKNADFMKKYVDRGELGQKSRKGFYTYPSPEYTRPGSVAGHSEA